MGARIFLIFLIAMSAHWTTLITTPDYADGLLCLAYSLLIVKSRASLICYVPSREIQLAIETAAGLRYPVNLIIRMLPSFLYDDVFNKDLSRDVNQFIDAPRRFLFLQGTPFIFLDSDMVATQNFDELLDYIDDSQSLNSFSNYDIIAVPNFRNKKKGYGGESGNFNAGMMIVPNPQKADYDQMIQVLSAGYNDTEEKLLNDVFRNRWKALPIGYNCQKRTFKFAPAVWNEVHASETGIKIVHYVGGKPWQSAEDIRRLDWEGSSSESMAPYNALFQLWHKLRRGDILLPEQLLDAIPRASISP